MEIYTVKKGDTLYLIAKKFGISLNLLLQINGLREFDDLVVGQSILIAYPQKTITVKSDDTADEIVARQNITLNELYRNNPCLRARPDLIEGQTLVISYKCPKFKPSSFFGYAYLNVDLDLLRTTLPFLDYLTPFTYGVTSMGELIPLGDQLLTTLSLKYGVNSILHVSTLTEDGNFNNQLAEDILSDESKMDVLVENIVALSKLKNYAGVDVDFEFIPALYAKNYAVFIDKLRKKLNAIDKFVMVALAPKTSSSQKGLLYEGHDYKLLSQAANYVFIMTYEWGYTYGPPMAVAPIEAVKKVLDYALTQMPGEKIYLGIPNYGYDFTLPFVEGKSKAKLIGNQEALTIARMQNASILFDEASKSPHFEYYNQEKQHAVWFEDARSIYEKLSLVRIYHLKGAGYWNLMRPFTQNWQLINSIFKYTC